MVIGTNWDALLGRLRPNTGTASKSHFIGTHSSHPDGCTTNSERKPMNNRPKPTTADPMVCGFCRDCGYWSSAAEVMSADVGICGRYPPKVDPSRILAAADLTRLDFHAITAMQAAKVYTATEAEDGCGEFRERLD